MEEGRRAQCERNRERGAAASAGSEPREWDPKAKSTNAQTVPFFRGEWRSPLPVRLLVFVFKNFTLTIGSRHVSRGSRPRVREGRLRMKERAQRYTEQHACTIRWDGEGFVDESSRHRRSSSGRRRRRRCHHHHRPSSFQQQQQVRRKDNRGATTW